MTEITSEGLIARHVAFDEGDVDAAYAELERRFVARRERTDQDLA